MNYKSIKILTIFIVFVSSLCSTIKPTLHSNFYLRNNSLRIVHGIPAKLGDFPYQVSFKKGGPIYSSFCGGSIIKPDTVLTAAHCFVKKNNGICVSFWRGSNDVIRISDVYVVAGNLMNKAVLPAYDSKSCEQWRRLKTVKYPYRFNFPTQDIALVFTQKPWQYNKCVGFINPAVKPIEYQISCVASGYGRTITGLSSPVLLYTTLRVIPTATCNQMHDLNMMHYICTYNWPSDVGKGDSGGPLVCRELSDPNDFGSGLLVGITCGKRGYHTFFTRVASYADYIMSNKSYIPESTVLTLLCTSLILVAMSLK